MRGFDVSKLARKERSADEQHELSRRKEFQQQAAEKTAMSGLSSSRRVLNLRPNMSSAGKCPVVVCGDVR